jgi:hypothetical protein
LDYKRTIDREKKIMSRSEMFSVEKINKSIGSPIKFAGGKISLLNNVSPDKFNELNVYKKALTKGAIQDGVQKLISTDI